MSVVIATVLLWAARVRVNNWCEGIDPDSWAWWLSGCAFISSREMFSGLLLAALVGVMLLSLRQVTRSRA